MPTSFTQQELVQVILRDLNTPHVFPAGALVNAHHVRTELEPHLLTDLHRAIEAVQRDEDPSHMSFHALYLLSEFRTPGLYQVLLKILRLNEDQLEVLLGDALTDAMGRMLAANYDEGATECLWDIFDDQSLYEFARGATLTCLLILLLHNRVAYGSVIPQVKLRLEQGMEAGRTGDVTALVELIMDARISALYDLAQCAFERNLIDEFHIGGHRDFVKTCALPPDLHYKHHNVIQSAFEELRGWHSVDSMAPIALGGRLLIKIGRNEDCFCNSGKKYKKCCLGRTDVARYRETWE